jgi:hypothetical protein
MSAWAGRCPPATRLHPERFERLHLNGPRPPGPGPAAGPATPAWGPSLAYLGVALGTVAGGLAWWWASSAAPAPPPVLAAGAPLAEPAVRLQPAPPAAPLQAAAASGPVAAAAPQVQRQREPGGDLTPDITDHINQGEQPSMAEVIQRLHQAGVHTGLGAFSPPGTKPPLLGLAVPEDFVLPPGYVRHHQATDDGQRIEAILMFAPGLQLLDAAQQPIAMPADRVVPPELAPPGLPIRRIVVPAPTAPAAPGRPAR